MSLSHPAVVALQHRNFRLLWAGLLLSFTGSYMQNAVLLWHVSLLAPPGRKGLALGMVGLVRVVPIVTFSMIAGVIADAHNRRRLMIVTQTGAALVAVALAAATWHGLSSLWPLYTLAALGGAVGAFDLPARQSLVPTLVPRARRCRCPPAPRPAVPEHPASSGARRSRSRTTGRRRYTPM